MNFGKTRFNTQDFWKKQSPVRIAIRCSLILIASGILWVAFILTIRSILK